VFMCLCAAVPAANGGGKSAAPRGRRDDSAAGERGERPHPQTKALAGPAATGTTTVLYHTYMLVMNLMCLLHSSGVYDSAAVSGVLRSTALCKLDLNMWPDDLNQSDYSVLSFMCIFVVFCSYTAGYSCVHANNYSCKCSRSCR